MSGGSAGIETPAAVSVAPPGIAFVNSLVAESLVSVIARRQRRQIPLKMIVERGTGVPVQRDQRSKQYAANRSLFFS